MRMLRTMLAPSRVRKNARYSVMNRLMTSVKRSWPKLKVWVAISSLPCVSSALNLRCTWSKLPRPKRRKNAISPSGRALNSPRSIKAGLTSPDWMRAYICVASRASETSTSTAGSTTTSIAAPMVASAARVCRWFMRGNNQR